MSPSIQTHIRLFDQVELVITTVGAKLKSTVEPDGRIHFDVIGSDGSVIQSSVAAFHVFWSNQRQNRALFDREVLEQLIIKRVQDFHDEISLLRVVITRVELEEVRALQDEIVTPPYRYTWTEADTQRGTGILTGLGLMRGLAQQDNVPEVTLRNEVGSSLGEVNPGYAHLLNDPGQGYRAAASNLESHIGTLVSDAAHFEPAPLGQDHPAAVVID